MTQTSKGIEEFKQEIRSILIANKDGLPQHRVSRDYYDFLGKAIPYRVLGYSSEIDLFKSIPDAVRVVNRGEFEFYLYAVSNEKTAHLEKLVSKQEKKDKHPRSRTAAFVPPRMQSSGKHNKTIPNFSKVPPWLKNNILNLVSSYPQGLQVDNVNCAYRKAYGTDLNHKDYNYANIMDFLELLENENILKLCENSNMSFIYPNHQSEVEHSYNVLNSNPENKENMSMPEHEVSNEREHEFVNRTVLENLRKVIERFPDGFPITQLCENYKEITGSLLDSTELSYNNILELVSDLDDIFRVQVNSTGDWILLDARLSPKPEEHTEILTNHELVDKKEIPDRIQQNIYDLLEHFPDGIDLQQFQEIYKINFGKHLDWKEFHYQSLESVLMSLKLNPPIRFVRSGLNNVIVMLSPIESVLPQVAENPTASEHEQAIPDDAVLLGQVYTPVKVSCNETYFPVLVSSVDSPGKIWLQKVSATEKRNVELDNLMDDLEDFYQSLEAGKYKIPEKYLMISLNCAVLYAEDQSWHRGCIIGKTGPTSYKVFYYDYGTICIVEKSLLRLLKKSFAVLPAQAFCARLAWIKPLSTFYSSEAYSRLFELCFERPLMALITSNTYMNMTSVLLCDTTGEDDVFIHEILVKEGLVERCDDTIGLRKPYEITSSYNCNSGSPNSIPARMPTCDANLTSNSGLSTSGFYNSLGSVVTHLNPMQLASRFTTDVCQSFVSTSALNNSQTYNPSSMSLDTNNVFNPEIFRRIEKRKLAERKMIEEGSNVPKATVEPTPVLKTRPLHSKFTRLLMSENQSDRNEPDSPHVKNYEIEEDEMYDSSQEEDDKQEPVGLLCSLASAVSNPCSNQLRFCKKACFRDEKYSAHLINFNRKPCFTSAHLSSFIFGVDIVKRILHIQNYPPCHILVSRADHPTFFQELQSLEILDFTEENSKTDKVVLYTLSDVLKILVFLNHNKETLVEDIEELQQSFDPDDEYWMSNEESIKVHTYEETLQEKCIALKEERMILLRVMLAEDCSSLDDAKRLLKIHQDIHDVKTELAQLKSQSRLRSTSEQAQEFLERAKLDSQTEKCPVSRAGVASTTVLTSHTVSAPIKAMTPSTVSTPTTFVQLQANTQAVESSVAFTKPVLANQNALNNKLLPVGQTAIPLQGYAPANHYRVAHPLPVNYPIFYPNRYTYQQPNLQFPPVLSFSNPQYY